MTYQVFVDDNFHFMDESERYLHGEFDTCEEAIVACKKIVDDCLKSSYQPKMSADQLYESYIGFGDDPFIKCDDKSCDFHARDYAKSRCQAIIDEKITS
ncbi:MAG: hypothetical protein WC851_01705 [Candidatus Shapirobacteria bacterium]|jgi:hypothetical protein